MNPIEWAYFMVKAWSLPVANGYSVRWGIEYGNETAAILTYRERTKGK